MLAKHAPRGNLVGGAFCENNGGEFNAITVNDKCKGSRGSKGISIPTASQDRQINCLCAYFGIPITSSLNCLWGLSLGKHHVTSDDDICDSITLEHSIASGCIKMEITDKIPDCNNIKERTSPAIAIG